MAKIILCIDGTANEIGARETNVLKLYKALDKFSIARATWHLLAADRVAWRQTLRDGFPPLQFRRPRPAPLPPPIALTRPRRASTATANYTAADYNPSTVYYNHY